MTNPPPALPAQSQGRMMLGIIKADLSYNSFWIVFAYLVTMILTAISMLDSQRPEHTYSIYLPLSFGLVMQVLYRKTEKRTRLYALLPANLAIVGTARILSDITYVLLGYWLHLLVILSIAPAAIITEAPALLRLLIYLWMLAFLVNFLHDVSRMISGPAGIGIIVLAVSIFIPSTLFLTIPSERIGKLFVQLGLGSLGQTVVELTQSGFLLILLAALQIILLACTVAFFVRRSSYLE